MDNGSKFQCTKSGKQLVWDKGLPLGDASPKKQGGSSSQSFAWPSPGAKYITAVPVDLEQINSISKYASCSGHNRDGYTFDKSLVKNVSLKHYWYPIASLQGTLDRVKVFAPFDGTVSVIQLEADKGGLGRPRNGNGLGLTTAVDPSVVFSFGHVYFAKKLRIGDAVRAGDLLGYAAMSDPGFDFDTDLEARARAANGAEVLGSIFDHMDKKVLAAFAAHAITPSAMKIPLASRQSNACDFNSPSGRTTADWVPLKGQTLRPGNSPAHGAPAGAKTVANPGDNQKTASATDPGGPSFQQVGLPCDPAKSASGKASDGAQLACVANAADGKSYWQSK